MRRFGYNNYTLSLLVLHFDSSCTHGRPQEFFQRGANPRGLTKMTYFSARRRRKRKFSRFFRRFRLNLRVFHASAEGASENFRVFFTGTAYDVIIFKFQGGATAPGCPPPPGAYVSEDVWRMLTASSYKPT